jgi:hypothetical protein
MTEICVAAALLPTGGHGSVGHGSVGVVLYGLK